MPTPTVQINVLIGLDDKLLAFLMAWLEDPEKLAAMAAHLKASSDALTAAIAANPPPKES